MLTWLQQAKRDLLSVHRRIDPRRALHGVFSTRSPGRPNPVGLHCVMIVAMEGPLRLRMRNLEALNGAPIIDVKPLLDPIRER